MIYGYSTDGKCSCGWLVPQQVVLESKTPEFIPDDIELVYFCPQCKIVHVVAFNKNYEQKPQS